MHITQENIDYNKEKYVYSSEEKLFFSIGIITSYALMKTLEETNSFPSPVKEILFGCITIGCLSPVP